MKKEESSQKTTNAWNVAVYFIALWLDVCPDWNVEWPNEKWKYAYK